MAVMTCFMKNRANGSLGKIGVNRRIGSIYSESLGNNEYGHDNQSSNFCVLSEIPPIRSSPSERLNKAVCSEQWAVKAFNWPLPTANSVEYVRLCTFGEQS
jgi:hypothetical protein